MHLKFVTLVPLLTLASMTMAQNTPDEVDAVHSTTCTAKCTDPDTAEACYKSCQKTLWSKAEQGHAETQAKMAAAKAAENPSPDAHSSPSSPAGSSTPSAKSPSSPAASGATPAASGATPATPGTTPAAPGAAPAKPGSAPAAADAAKPTTLPSVNNTSSLPNATRQGTSPSGTSVNKTSASGPSAFQAAQGGMVLTGVVAFSATLFL
ncbi:MAG: hypothetical protein DHS80DRAFT_23688 [Piptocephalis tieghemiana]|nr:MAG: hypothetical protein DHS80DRAFT_23688 [Piptocephalis tieghemiana]